MVRLGIQVAGVTLLAFAAGHGAIAVKTAPKLVLNSPEPARRQPAEPAALVSPVEKLIAKATDATAGDASDAAAQLFLAGSADPKIVTLLLQRLDEEKGRPAVIAILARIGNKVTPQALTLLNDERAEVRWSALRLLLCFDNLSPSITPRVARCLKDEDVWVRRWAVMLLAQLDNKSCASDLMAACRDRDAEVRWRALRALQHGRSPSALPESLLRDALADTDSDVRYVATRLPQSTVVGHQP